MANVTHETITIHLVIVVNVTIFVIDSIAKDMTTDEHVNELIAYFIAKDYFTKDDVLAYSNAAGISIKDDALRLRIHRWKKKGIIQSVALGKYTISKKPVYTPEPDKLLMRINKLFLSVYDEIDYCTWSTKWLHDLMFRIPVKSFYVFETEKEICEPTFYLLKDYGYNAYYEPDQNQIDKYVLPEEDSVIVKPLVTRAPYYNIGDSRLACIEKILVDLYCDTNIFYIYGGRELKRIYENVLSHYTINFSTLLHYAARRKRAKKIREFMLKNFSHLIKGIIG